MPSSAPAPIPLSNNLLLPPSSRGVKNHLDQEASLKGKSRPIWTFHQRVRVVVYCVSYNDTKLFRSAYRYSKHILMI